MPLKPITFVCEDDKKKSALYFLGDSLKRIQVAQELHISAPTVNNNERPKWYWKTQILEDAVRIIVFSFECAMDNTHHLDYVVRTEGNKMVKIGQFPSVADLAFPLLEDYKNDLDKQSRNELRRALGLHAQGIGVGSYIYLRRIFERILETARQQAKVENTIDLSEYDRMRVVERIKLLKDYLPAMISSNPAIYGIVSKGVHELSEEECLKYFPVLRDCVLMILEQWAEKRKKQEMAKNLQASINAIASEIK